MKQTTLMLLLLVCTLATRAQAVLYSDINYGGTAISFPVGNYTLASMTAAGFPDDAVSSFYLPAGYQITFFADDNFTGKTFSATSSSTWIGTEWNDQVTSFIVSLIPPSQGAANWIWSPDAGPANTWIAFRKNVTLATLPATALTKIAAENKYWLYINNQLVVKDGGLSIRPDLVNTYYDEVDIAPYLQAGENTIAILVWYKGGQNGYSERAVGNGGLLFDAGSVAVSDDTWKYSIHPSFGATTQLILNGQDYKWIAFPVSYNAANEPAGWTSAGFNDAAWATAVKKGAPGAAPWNGLVPRGIPFWKEAALSNYQNAIPTSITANTSITGTVGSNIQLRPYLHVNAPAGVKIKINVNRFYWQEYITKAGDQEFECFAWQNSSSHAVTYEFSNVTGTVQILGLKYRETSYNADMIGQFNCSDASLNTLWTKAKNTSKVCMRDQYYDCPDRERGQWWGDVSEQILYSFYIYDTSVNKLTRKAFRELMNTQKANGSLYTTAPGTRFHLPDQNLAAVATIWKYYMYTGDAALLQEIYPQLKKYIQFCVASSNADGMILLQSDAWNWIDWGTNIDPVPVGSANTVVNALYIAVLQTAINTANLLGQTADATYYQGLQTKVKNNFNNYFWNSALRAYVSSNVSSRVVDDRSNAWALSTGLANDQQKAGAMSVLTNRYDASPYQEMYIEEALFKLDPAAAITRMKNRFTPMINSWSSTLWEDFTESNSNAGYSSNNHAWSAGPLYVMSAYLLGIRPTQPGYTEFTFAPQPGGITQFSGIVPSVKGNITASFSLGSSSFTQSLVSPYGTTAIVSVPKDVFSTLIGEITVGGITVWKNGTFLGGVSGVSFLQQDDKSVQFKVTPGNWQFTALPYSNTDPVITYTDCNYSGTAVSLPVGNYTLAQMTAKGIPDDAISSLMVAEGYKVILYADDNFTGQTETLTAGNNCITWSPLHDKTTSIRVLTNGVTNLSGTYFIRNRASGLQLDVNGASTADGASVIHSEYNGNANQQFMLTHLGDGNYKILAKHSSKSLDVNGASLVNGANVIQYPYHDPVESHQNFIIVATGDGYYKMIAKHSGKVLQVNGVTGGGLVHQWSNMGQVNGQWVFTPGAAAVATTSSLSVDPNPATNMITVKVAATKNDKLYMRIYNVSGTLVRPAQKIYSGQQFNLSALPAGVYIVNVTIGDKEVSQKIVKY